MFAVRIEVLYGHYSHIGNSAPHPVITVRLAVEDARQRVGDSVAVERAASRQHLEQHAAERDRTL
jgi:hypothetical protein